MSFLGFGKKVEHAAAEHFLNTLVTSLQKDGTAKIPGVGIAHLVRNLKTNQYELKVDLDVSFKQRLERTGSI